MLAAVLAIACCTAIALVPVASASAAGRGHRGDHHRGHAARHGHRAPLGGVNIGAVSGGMNLSQLDRDVATARQLHAKLVRVAISWASFEPLGPGRPSAEAITAADRLMHDVAEAHIKVIALVFGTPCWASAAPASLLKRCSPGGHSEAMAYPPRKASDYAAFVSWLAKRFGSHLAAIEVWNEPDQVNQKYFAGPNKPQRYAKLLRAAYPAIKHADRHVKVLAGSLVGSNGAFMNALYKAGIKGYYDGVAVHFYTLGLGALRAFHENQLRHGDHKPLWFDEFGWSSCWPKEKIQQEQGCVTKKIQARNISDTFRQLAHTRWVAAETTYDLQDAPKQDFGVLDVKGKAKPSFHALARVLRSPFGKPSPVRLQLTRQHGHVIATGSAPVGDYMKLEAFQHGRLRYKAIFTLNRFDRYKLKLPSVLGTHGLTVRVWQYWMGRKHGAQRSI